VPYPGGAEAFRCALRVRRSVAKPHELTFSLTPAPEATTRAERVRVAGARWTIESLFEPAKGEVGLDQYEIRSWVGGHRHSTLAMVALAYLAAVRKAAMGGVAPVNRAADLWPLTVPEVRPLLWALVGQSSPQSAAALHWSAWRRNHQQRAPRSLAQSNAVVSQ
jgi:hypothetical protein